MKTDSLRERIADKLPIDDSSLAIDIANQIIEEFRKILPTKREKSISVRYATGEKIGSCRNLHIEGENFVIDAIEEKLK